MHVALRKESVDRNVDCGGNQPHRCESLSARRAWIEISYGALAGASEMSLSARRAWIEIVCPLLMFWLFRPSLSARRAWIEIDIDDKFGGLMSVALRKESVDRNADTVLNA